MLYASEVTPARDILEDQQASPDLPQGPKYRLDCSMGTTVRNPVTALAEAAEGGHNPLPGADVLEALFYLADPHGDCRQIAEEALRAFGSVGDVLSAHIPQLINKLGVKQEIAHRLKAIHISMCSVLKEQIPERVRIGSFHELIEYVGVSLNHTVEVLRILYLDRKNGLISDDQVNRGAVGRVPVSPREIVRRALELGASAVIIMHHHSSGDPIPSDVEVSFSQQVEHALSVMNITLHDSLVVGNSASASLRSLGRLRHPAI